MKCTPADGEMLLKDVPVSIKTSNFLFHKQKHVKKFNLMLYQNRSEEQQGL